MGKIFRTKPSVALQIARMENGVLYFVDGTEARPNLGDEYHRRFNPAVGGYYVRYITAGQEGDGPDYESYLPEEVLGIEFFDEGDSSKKDSAKNQPSSPADKGDKKKSKVKEPVKTQPVNTKPEVTETTDASTETNGGSTEASSPESDTVSPPDKGAETA